MARVVRFHETGGPEVLRIEEVERRPSASVVFHDKTAHLGAGGLLGYPPIVRTTRNRALPLIIRS
jgi:hypothetical protein